MGCLGENHVILLRSLCWKKMLPKVISLSLQSSVNCSTLFLVMLAEPWGPMVDSIAWQFFNLRIEVSHQGFDVLFRDFINSVLVLIIYVVIISFHCWSMYLNYGDLDMPFLKCEVVICSLTGFQPIRAFVASAYSQDMIFYIYIIFY